MSQIFIILENLAERARKEAPPMVDVASKVLARLSHEDRPKAWSLLPFASCALVCSTVVLSFSLSLIEMVLDPWSHLFVAAVAVLR